MNELQQLFHGEFLGDGLDYLNVVRRKEYIFGFFHLYWAQVDIVLPVLSGGFVWEHFCYLTYNYDIIITVFFYGFGKISIIVESLLRNY